VSAGQLDETSNDDGITLVELLVAILLLAVASAMVTNLYFSTTKAVATSSSLTQNTRTAANAMDEISRVIRVANSNLSTGNTVNPAVVEAKPESITIISYVDSKSLVEPEPSKVEFSVDPTTRQIVERRWTASKDKDKYWVFLGSASSTRILPGRVIAPSGADAVSLFTYLEPHPVKENAELGEKVPLSNAAGGLTSEQRKKVRSIRVTLVIRGAEDGKSAPVTLQNDVGMPNLNAVKVTP